MTNVRIFHLIPYFISILISMGVWAYTWRRRAVTGARAFLWFVLAEILHKLFHILFLLESTVEGKIFFGNLRFVVSAVGPMALVHFSLVFTQRKFHNPKLTWGLLLSISFIFAGIIYTNGYHHLIYPENIKLIEDSPFLILEHSFTPMAWIILGYGYFSGLLGIAFLITNLFGKRRIFRIQIFIVLFGIIFLLFGVSIPILFGERVYQYILSFFISSIGNLLIALGLFRYRLFDIVPVARDLLIESMQDAVMVLDGQDRIIDVNPAMLAILNRPEMEVMGKSISGIFSNWHELQKEFTESSEQVIEYQIGEEHPQRDFALTVTNLNGDGEQCTGQLIVIRDITGQKQTERDIRRFNEKLRSLNFELEDANQQLLELSKVKDEFVANVSHELRTPLTNIMLYHDLMVVQPERVPKHLAILRRETDRLSNLIEALLAISRFDQGVVRLYKTKFDLNVLVHEYVEDRKVLAEAKDLHIEVGDEAENALVHGDRNLIGQVLSILMTNAINYTPSGGNVEISTQLRNEGVKPHVGFIVKDTGIGIPSDEQKQLFERFFRGKSGSRLGISGTGLGLAIAKEIVDRHGGEIEIQSRGIVGEGTAFTVWIPLSEAQ